MTVKGCKFDLQSYRKRGWCRLEQWARISQCGLEGLYLCGQEAGGAPLHDLSRDVALLRPAMEFMHGDFTVTVRTRRPSRPLSFDRAMACVMASVCLSPRASLSVAPSPSCPATLQSDRMHLIDTSIALYSLLLAKSTTQSHALTPTMEALLAECKERRDELFPPALFDDLMQITEDLAETGGACFRLKRRAPAEEEQSAKARGQPTTELFEGSTYKRPQKYRCNPRATHLFGDRCHSFTTPSSEMALDA